MMFAIAIAYFSKGFHNHIDYVIVVGVWGLYNKHGTASGRKQLGLRIL